MDRTINHLRTTELLANTMVNVCAFSRMKTHFTVQTLVKTRIKCDTNSFDSDLKHLLVHTHWWNRWNRSIQSTPKILEFDWKKSGPIARCSIADNAHSVSHHIRCESNENAYEKCLCKGWKHLTLTDFNYFSIKFQSHSVGPKIVFMFWAQNEFRTHLKVTK